jgi:hypothetical protein
MSKSALQKAERRVRDALVRAQEYRDEKESKKAELEREKARKDSGQKT